MMIKRSRGTCRRLQRYKDMWQYGVLATCPCTCMYTATRGIEDTEVMIRSDYTSLTSLACSYTYFLSGIRTIIMCTCENFTSESDVTTVSSTTTNKLNALLLCTVAHALHCLTCIIHRILVMVYGQ